MPINTLPVSPNGEISHNDVREKVNEVATTINLNQFDKRFIVKSPQDLAGVLDSTSVYFLDGVIDFTGTGLNISVPAGGLTLTGHSFEISKIKCDDDNYTLFTSPGGGSGNLLGSDYAIEVTGLNSKAYDLVSATGNDAFEFARINYDNCTSLGEIDGYRQGFETGTGRFGGSPSLTLSGTWLGGYFIDASIVRGLSPSMTSGLFMAAASFVMNSRFRSNMNVDLPTNAYYADFSASNFPNASTVQMDGAIITRNGVQDSLDLNIFPNLTAGELPSQWKNNIGLDNTYVGGKVTNTLEAVTTISVQGDFYDISGASLPGNLEHFDSPNAFQLRHLGVNPRDYTVYLDAVVDGTQSDELQLKVVKWDNSAGVFVDVISQRRRVDNLIGGRDVTYFNLLTPVQLDQNDYVKWQIANTSSTNNVTLELDSFMLVSER